jgi:thymidylate synthase (FAD)
MESVRLTRLDREVIRRLAATGQVPASPGAFLAAQDPSWQGLDRCRERDECLAKLVDLGLVTPG